MLSPSNLPIQHPSQARQNLALASRTQARPLLHFEPVDRRTLTLSFRRKPGNRAVKVYVTVRLWDRPGPKQLHLGYLPAGDLISACDRRRLEHRLWHKWRQHFGPGNVAVDWLATERKWRRLDQPRPAPLDRAAARQQLGRWLSGTKETLLPHFGGPKRQTSRLTAGEFQELFLKSHRGIAERLRHAVRSVDPAEVATWWEQREAPRLLCCFYRLTRRRPGVRFDRAGFLRYLAGNIRRGFALAQFLREHPAPLLSLLPESQDLDWLNG